MILDERIPRRILVHIAGERPKTAPENRVVLVRRVNRDQQIGGLEAMVALVFVSLYEKSEGLVLESIKRRGLQNFTGRSVDFEIIRKAFCSWNSK